MEEANICCICLENKHILFSLSFSDDKLNPCCSGRVCEECSYKLWTGTCPNCRQIINCSVYENKINHKIKKRTNYVRWNPVRSCRSKKAKLT